MLALGTFWGLATGADAAPAGVRASVKRNALEVTGTSGADTVTLRVRAGDSQSVEVDVGADGTPDFRFDRSRFSTIRVTGAGGADRIAIDNINGAFTDTEATTLDGGNGADTLTGGSGGETLVGGPGQDFLDGNQGLDTVAGGDDDDTFQWDPGDASDTILGGTGADRLVFNGSAIGELFDLSAAAGHVRLTRNIGTIALDLDDLETIDLRPFAGTDTITIGDLTGTDLATLTADLAALGGGDDAARDSIVAPPGVTVGRDGSTATVSGLGARVRVLGAAGVDDIHITGTPAADGVTIAGTTSADTIVAVADGTDVVIDDNDTPVLVRLTAIETTTVDLDGGTDTFAAVGNLAPLTTLDVDGGADNDTITGGNGPDLLAGGPGQDFIDGNQGLDTVAGGDDDDTFQWDPGDASDTILGGTGADRLVFNGSAIGELFDLSAAAGHVRLTRNIGTIALDLDDLETIDLRPFAGTDTITIGDLTGTDLATLTADLAALGGGDDAARDSIVAPPGVTVGRDGSTATVSGLGARVRVLGAAGVDDIHITGTPAADGVTIAGTTSADTIVAVADGTDVVIDDNDTPVLVRLTAIETTTVDLDGGTDTFAAVGNLAPLTTLDVDGGADNDTITGGNGPDLLAGGPGQDFIDGNQGLDTVAGGDDDDTFQWDPGDASDTILGGTGADRLVFNGSAIGELFDLSAAAGHVRLTRNIGTIALDLDDLETIDLRPFAGTDTITIGDLTGTDLATLTADLAALGGDSADGVADVVTVNGTDADDAIDVVAEGPAVVVQGLVATVRITGADPTLDLLAVHGLEGNDTVTATPAAGALIQLNLMS